MLLGMDVHVAGLTNLAEFVAATAGRTGEVARVRGGVAIASPFPMAHGFVTTALRTDPEASAVEFLDDVSAFFAERQRAFVVWVPAAETDLAKAVVQRGGALGGEGSPAMVAHAPVPDPPGFTVTHATEDPSGVVFGELAEAGYEMPGMGWLMGEHDSFTAPGTTWAMVSSDAEPDLGPISVACGYRHGTTGGVYYVATPAQFQRRGAAAAVTAAVTNELFAGGAPTVTLQATSAGFPVYERLGFEQYGAFFSCELGENAPT